MKKPEDAAEFALTVIFVVVLVLIVAYFLLPSPPATPHNPTP